MRRNRTIVVEAVAQDKAALRFVDKSIRDDPFVINASVTRNATPVLIELSQMTSVFGSEADDEENDDNRIGGSSGKPLTREAQCPFQQFEFLRSAQGIAPLSRNASRLTVVKNGRCSGTKITTTPLGMYTTIITVEPPATGAWPCQMQDLRRILLNVSVFVPSAYFNLERQANDPSRSKEKPQPANEPPPFLVFPAIERTLSTLMGGLLKYLSQCQEGQQRLGTLFHATPDYDNGEP